MSGIKLEVGRRYVDREGQEYGPLTVQNDEDTFPFICTKEGHFSWMRDGSYSAIAGEQHPRDLIAEAPDEAPQQVSGPHRIVPVEPTEEMLSEAEEIQFKGWYIGRKLAREVWETMLHEAPQRPDELATLRERVRELEEWNRKMVEMAASKNNLDGYRELGQRAAQAESIADTLSAENARLREALGKLTREIEYLVNEGTLQPIALTHPEYVNARALAQTEAENG